MTQHSLRPRDVSGIKEKRDPVYQISTLQSLILGNYYGCLYIEDLLKHGDNNPDCRNFDYQFHIPLLKQDYKNSDSR